MEVLRLPEVETNKVVGLKGRVILRGEFYRSTAWTADRIPATVVSGLLVGETIKRVLITGITQDDSCVSGRATIDGVSRTVWLVGSVHFPGAQWSVYWRR